MRLEPLPYAIIVTILAALVGTAALLAADGWGQKLPYAMGKASVFMLSLVAGIITYFIRRARP